MAALKSWLEGLWSDERRRADRRKALPLVAYYWDGGTPTPHRVRDISSSGMFLLTEYRWYPDTVFAITLTRTDRNEEDPHRSIRLAARMVRPEASGVGLEFVLLRPKRAQDAAGTFAGEADRETLREFLARLKADTGSKAIKRG